MLVLDCPSLVCRFSENLALNGVNDMQKQQRSGAVKAMEAMVHELRGIKHFLAALYREQYLGINGDIREEYSADLFAEEFITVEEAARRLSVSEQTINNWIVRGATDPDKGWIQGIHFIYLPVKSKHKRNKGLARIAWNAVVRRYHKDSASIETDLLTGSSIPSKLRMTKRYSLIPDPSVPDDDLV